MLFHFIDLLTSCIWLMNIIFSLGLSSGLLLFTALLMIGGGYIRFSLFLFPVFTRWPEQYPPALCPRWRHGTL